LEALIEARTGKGAALPTLDEVPVQVNQCCCWHLQGTACLAVALHAQLDKLNRLPA
jgi:hypothetical protein